MSKIFGTFSKAVKETANHLQTYGTEILTEKWQGLDLENKPEYQMIEVIGYSFAVPMISNLEELRTQIQPNIPWADDHFQERVGGVPLNPGNEYANWPYYKNNKANDKFRTVEEEKFSHTYMERIWTPDIEGIRYTSGNLGNVLDLLEKEPFTRQAFLPIWFPEDTGVVHGGRVPCTIGYHFIRRHNYLHVFYYIRSCDLLRHFRDDIYLCVRKVIWMIDELKKRDPEKWGNVVPGLFTMNITSLHGFKSDSYMIKKLAEKSI